MFAPYIILLPPALIATPANAFLFLGWKNINQYKETDDVIDSESVWNKSSENIESISSIIENKKRTTLEEPISNPLESKIQMKQLNYINELREFNTPGNHWISASQTDLGIMTNEVEYVKIEEWISINAPTVIRVFSPDLEPIATYAHSAFSEEIQDIIFDNQRVKNAIIVYGKFKKIVNTLNGNLFFIYSPIDKIWVNVKYDQVITGINKTGFFAVRIASDKGEVLYSYTHPALNDSLEHLGIITSFDQVLAEEKLKRK